MDYRAAPHYNEMFEAAAKEGIYLYAISGYRSVTRQRNNFERKIQYYRDQGYSKVEATQMAARIILPPGTSEHNAGLAVDILSLEQSFENTKEFRWLDAHAHEYGFIMRYPKNKEDVTEIIYEPWHYRYVGVETAKKIKASGLCYEEYLKMA
ncbi:MAG: M15 family metallopeptidase [Clostridia bacterium]|nr:M15 family metallopeptidase [Clostridia bacterium]